MPAKVTIQDVRKKYDDFLRLVHDAADKPRSVHVGVFASEGSQAKTTRDDASQTARTLIEVAIANEFGAPAGDAGRWETPERSFIRGWVDENKVAILKVIKMEVVRAAINGEKDLTLAMERIGLWAQGQIQQRIADGISPENSPSTIRRKGSSTPLIDTGQLRSSITYKVSR